MLHRRNSQSQETTMSLEGFLEINIIVIARAALFRPKQSQS
jgi:hypothetical protein